MPALQLNRLTANTALWLVGLLLVLPFSFGFLLNVPDGTVAFFAFHWIALALGLAAIALLPWAGKEHGIRIPYSVLPLLGLIGICLYQFATLDSPYSAPYITYITYMGWAVALFILGTTLHQSLGPEKLLQSIAWFGLIGALLAATTGLLQMSGVPQSLKPWIVSFHGNFPIGNVRHPNFFTCHMMLGLLSLTYLLGMRKIPLLWFLPSVLLLVTALAFSPSRTLYLYFLLTLSWAAWVAWRARNIASKRLFIALLFSFALLLLLQWGLLPLLEQQAIVTNENAASRLLKFQNDGQLFSRIDAWIAAWKMFLQHPVLGGGIGNYPWFHFLLTEHKTIGAFSNPHSLPLFYLATTGIIGTSLLLLFLFVIAHRMFALCHDTRYWFPASVLLIILIYSILEFPLWLPAFLGITAFLCGALHPDGWTLKPFKMPAKLAYMLFIGICTLFLLDTLQAYRKLGWAEAGNAPQQVFDKHVRNAIKNPWLRPYAERSFLNKRLILNDAGAANALLRMNTRQMHWLPSERTLIRQPILLSAVGRHEEALQMYAKTSTRYPKLNRHMLTFCEKHPNPKLQELCHAAKDISRDRAE